MVVRTKKKDYVISDVKKDVIQDKAKLIYSELTKYEGKTVGVDEFCEYGAITNELWCIAYTSTFLAVDYLEHLNNRLTEFFERLGRIDLHCKILSLITFVHKSIHELRYSVNQERDFNILENNIIVKEEFNGFEFLTIKRKVKNKSVNKNLVTNIIKDIEEIGEHLKGIDMLFNTDSYIHLITLIRTYNNGVDVLSNTMDLTKARELRRNAKRLLKFVLDITR